MNEMGRTESHLGNENPDVSITIRVRNGAKWLPHTLRRIFEQKFDGTFEVVILDNESTDRSLDICKSFPTRILHISRDEFTFGRSFNRCCEAARGRFIVSLSQDAVPLGTYWLQTLMDYCTQPGVAACSGVEGWWQVPKASSNFEPIAADAETFGREITKGSIVKFHTVFCAIRKEAWLEHRFNEQLPMGDDREWAHRVATNGWKVITGVPAIVSHDKGESQTRGNRFSLFYWSRYVERLQGWSGSSSLASFLTGILTMTFCVVRSSGKAIVKAWLQELWRWDACRLARRARKGLRPPRMLGLRPSRPDGQRTDLVFDAGLRVGYEAEAQSSAVIKEAPPRTELYDSPCGDGCEGD